MERLDFATKIIIAQLKGATGTNRDVEAGASAYLALVGLVAGGWMWLRMARVASECLPLLAEKVAIARFYADYLLPESRVIAARAVLGAACLDTLEDAALAATG